MTDSGSTCRGCNTTAEATYHGHLDCLRRLRSAGAPWHTHTTWWAAICGHLDCLKLAYSAGAPWDRKTATAAARKGHLHCLRYCYQSGKVVDPQLLLQCQHYERKLQSQCNLLPLPRVLQEIVTAYVDWL